MRLSAALLGVVFGVACGVSGGRPCSAATGAPTGPNAGACCTPTTGTSRSGDCWSGLSCLAGACCLDSESGRPCNLSCARAGADCPSAPVPEASCCSGLCGTDGICAPVGGAGSWCTSGADCASGRCASSKCG